MTESKENLKKRIDTNKNQYIENNEVDNFAKDKKNGDIDLNNLGEYLNNLPLYNNDELKKALNNFFRSPERNKYDQTIKNKVTNNQPLDKTELSLMYLAMIAEPNKHFTQQQLKFDSSKPVDQICNGALIGFIRTKYNFPTYTGKKVKIDLPNKTKKKTNNPIDKIQESKGGNIKLPENIGEIKESEADFYCDRLITRAEKNFANDIEKAKREIEQNHRYKDEEEKKAYIKRDTLLIAFSKYTEAINSQHEKHITNSGYKDKDDFENQMKLIEEFGKEIEKKYPNINDILEKIQKFDEEMKANEKKYFKNENETKKAEKNYKEFNDYMDKKSKEYDIDKIQESLKKEPKTKEEMEEYLQTMNKIFEFQENLNKKNKTYGNSISKYQKYIKGAADIQKKHNIQQYQDILENYNKDISNWNKKIDFKKYENYKNGLDWKLEVGLKNINTLQGIITDPDKNKNILVKEFKDIEDKQQIKQNGIDRIRERIKKFSPGAYWTLTTFTGLWNGLIDATIGVSTSLGVMILGIIGGTDETLSQMDRKARRDNFFKIGQSSSQKESVYNSETGFNFHADNTVSTVASSISQMLTLIYGGGAIGSGASKVLGISENIAGRVGLFTSSFITQVGGSYQEAITHGLTGKNAIGYSFLSATIQSSLELVSPNDVLLGKGNGIAKELIRNACNEGGKQSFMLIGKTFLKNVGLEILEENIQEGLQTAAGNLINMVVNGTYGSKLGADWSWKNFASTAIITTLTTGITTGVSTGVQMYEMSNQDQTKLIEHIKSDNGLYLEVTGMLDKAIEGKISIPNISIDQLQNLKLSLTGKGNINTPSRNTNVQTNYEIKISPEIEQISQILGSRFHEERKQSRLQSDGTYAPRVEKTSDQTWISQHNGQTEVDIANTHFEDLPSDWKSENLEAAKIAVGLIYDMVKKGEKVTSEMIEKMAEIVHNKRLERNGTEGSFENQRVHYEQLSESEKEKDRNQLLRAIETVKQGNTDYFDGKSHKFEVTESQARSNSENMDKILSEINEENKSEKLEELRKEITEQYKQATGEDLKLSDEQLLSILDAHEQDGELGKLKLGELKVKVKKLSEAIGDENIRRFLLEAGFCGKQSEIINDNKTNVEHLEELGIKIGALFSKKINNLNLDFEKLGKIKDLGVKIDQYNIDELNRIEGLDFEKLGKIKDLGVEIHANNIEKLNSMEGLDFEKLGKIKDLGVKLREPGRRLKGNLKNLNDIEIDFTTLWKLKELGIKIDELNIEKFNYLGLTNEDIQFIKENKLTEYNEIVFALILKDNTSKKTKQEYIKRKQEYLERNRTISEEKFMELFGLKGKYGKTEINQDRVGLCYAYTGFEILKKSNCFNELVQTNLREISDGKGWEVRLPMGDPDGKRIKVYGDEIDSKFERKYSNGDIETANINSESEYLGFKILEISFMKKYILETKENTKKIDYGIIKKAKLEYEKTGKITFNQELIEYIEGGEYYTFADILMMRGNCISLIKNEIDRVYGVNDNDKELAFKYFNTGTININIGINKENIKNNDYNKNLLNQDCEIINIDGRNGIIVHNVKIIDKAGYNFESTYRITEDGIIDKRFDEKGNYIGNKKMKEDLITNKEGKMIIQFFPNHAYSIEKCYTDDNTGEKRVWVINPRHTGLKFDISLEQAKSIFRWNVTGFDIDEMFREEENIEQTIDNQKENNDYFDGKSHQFEVTEAQARSNSENMDNLVNEINEENLKEKLQKLKNNIEQQYKQATGEELQLSDEQLLSIIDAHEQDGILGELTLGQLRQKVKTLDETITDPKLRRFLLEAGFCGKIEIISDIENNIPSLLNKNKKSSINFEFSKNNPELHESFIKTGIITKLINYTDIVIEKGGNLELLGILKQAQEELENLPYEERLKAIININTYIESAKKANRFINLVKRGGTTAKELFLRAKGENTNRITDFEGEITIKQFRNSIVFIFEKSNDVKEFFGGVGNGCHFESKIAGLDTIMINEENCKNAGKVGLDFEDAKNRTIFHESQHSINKFFMSKTKDITYQEAKDPEKTDIESFKQYALDRAKDEIIAQYTNRLIIKNLSKETISILSKGGGIKESLTKEGNVYDYFKERRNTPEGKKAREEHIEKVKNLIDCIDETFKTLLNSGFYSDTNIQNVLNLFSCTNITERKNIQNMINNKFNINEYFDGKSHKFEVTESQARSNSEMMDSEGLIFDSKYVTQKDAGIYRFNTKETTETQKNKPGYQSLQEAEQSLNNQIGGKYDKKLYQESFTKKHKNEDFEEDVDDFIKYATEKELNHKQIFLDLAKEASAKALFIGGPKKKDRIIEKVRNELLKEGEGLEALTDFTRATILFANFSDFEEGLKVLEKMKNEGRILDLKIRNRLTRPGCNDIFVNIQTPDGYVSEVQFHIPEVLVFRDEKLGDLSIDRYKSDNNILDKHTLTKDIFDLSNDKYKRNLEAYNKIIDRLNEGRDKDHLLSLPKEQDQIVYDHDMYDIIRVLEVYENADNLTLEDYELFTSKGFKHENIKDLLNDLRLMKEHLCNEALNRYRKRTK